MTPSAMISWGSKIKNFTGSNQIWNRGSPYVGFCTQWHNLNDIRQTFNSVDYVGNQRYVFNIKGNDYRLVVVIQFTPQFVYVRFIGTHSEYEKIDCSKI